MKDKRSDSYQQILQLSADGICDSCKYGVITCLGEGRPHCQSEKENKNEQEKSI